MNQVSWVLVVVVVVLCFIWSELSSIRRALEGVHKHLKSSDHLEAYRDIKPIKHNIIDCQQSLESIDQNTQPRVQD